jgi:multiple antibiotic resistance protein
MVGSGFISEWLKFFFLLTPFFVLSVFLTYTSTFSIKEKQWVAIRVTIAVTIICAILIVFGGHIFSLFGITLDSFRVGAGVLLFLSGINLARDTGKTQAGGESMKTMAVVPLSIPVTVGPATTGALLIAGADMRVQGIQYGVISGLLAGILSVGAILYLGSQIRRLIGETGIVILSRLTGLVLTAIAAQILFDGINGLLANQAK